MNLGVLYLSGRLPGHEQGEALGCFKQAADEGDLSGEKAFSKIIIFTRIDYTHGLCRFKLYV